MHRSPLTVLPMAALAICVAALLASCQRTPPSGTRTSNGRSTTSTSTGDGYSHAERPPFDPVATNGRVFVDWPQPKLALVIAGDMMGYIEPCGCAGIENQKGGLARRHTMVRELASQGWPVVMVDAGGLVRRIGTQEEIKYQAIADALGTMGCAAIGFGPDDLRLSAGRLAATAAEIDRDGRGFVSANVGLFGPDTGLVPTFRIAEAGGLKIGITAVLGESLREEVSNPDVVVSPVAESLAAVLPQLEAAGCDQLVLLAYAKPSESAELARQYPQFDIVVTAAGAYEPPLILEGRQVEGADSLLIEVGHKGMFAIVLGLYDDPQQPIRYQRVPLDSRYADSPEMKSVMASYQNQLQALGLNELGIHSQAHPRTGAVGELSGAFAGSASCLECHAAAAAVWSKSKHAHATESLTRLDPPRQYDPECISCHTTGWNPQAYLPYESGFRSLEETPELEGNGCENCHGPGAGHVAAERSRDLVARDHLRALMKLSKATVERQVCIQCHDADNSPAFHFDTYWPKVEHHGKK